MSFSLGVAHTRVTPAESGGGGAPASAVPYSMHLPFHHGCLCRITLTQAFKNYFPSTYCVALGEVLMREPWEK